MHPLDNPGWHALTGPHSGFAEWFEERRTLSIGAYGLLW